MQSVCVCHGCGRTIEKEFLYCPWCGFSQIENPSEHKLESVFTQLEEIQLQNKVKYIKMLDQELEELERYLETLALSVEMHK